MHHLAFLFAAVPLPGENPKLETIELHLEDLLELQHLRDPVSALRTFNVSFAVPCLICSVLEWCRYPPVYCHDIMLFLREYSTKVWQM